MGKRAGRLFPDIEVFYPDVLGLKMYVHQHLVKDPLPDNAFVFSMYNDQFMYFLIDADPHDPAVHFYNGDSFVWQYYQQFSEYLFDCIGQAAEPSTRTHP